MEYYSFPTEPTFENIKTCPTCEHPTPAITFSVQSAGRSPSSLYPLKQHARPILHDVNRPMTSGVECWWFPCAVWGGGQLKHGVLSRATSDNQTSQGGGPGHGAGAPGSCVSVDTCLSLQDVT